MVVVVSGGCGGGGETRSHATRGVNVWVEGGAIETSVETCD